ncbi:MULTISPECIES: PDR/VanB family oxidoreductase [Paraburkholderia]|uniref:PDR/VanB family oxidoreductase n=1 Tax=Paraburkholderia phytofirmans TaxID=261302 RepID=A0ABW9BI79_9BURK
MKVLIHGRRPIADGICEFDLRLPDGGPLPVFSAGSHVDVFLAGGVVRQYSLCNSPEERHRYVLAVLLDSNTRGGSKGMHALNVGDSIEIGEPRNHFALDETARHSILLAGGIGITPIKSMAHRLALLGASFEVHYCAREPDRMAYGEELKLGHPAPQMMFYFDRDAPDRQLDMRQVLGQRTPGTHLYVCGPQGFIDAVMKTSVELGWPTQNVHREYFGANPASQRAGDRPFQIRIASTGDVIDVAADITVVQALSRAGYAVPVSCEQGVCGTCLTRVLDGIPDHRDAYLTDDERAANDQFTPCCSRSNSSLLVLDI